MGWDTADIRIIASLSRHNSPQDQRDDELLEELRDEIGKLVEQPKYANINPMIL